MHNREEIWPHGTDYAYSHYGDVFLSWFDFLFFKI